jgi:hypothetical protein
MKNHDEEARIDSVCVQKHEQGLLCFSKWLTACPVESEQPGTEINYFQKSNNEYEKQPKKKNGTFAVFLISRTFKGKIFS